MSRVLISFVCTIFLLIAGLAKSSEAVVIPHGLPAEGISCDFVIKMAYPVQDYPMALHVNGSRLAVFGRYWITPDVIRVEVLWGEPLWSNDPFPEYPPGLIIVATRTNFTLAHDGGWRAFDYPLPVGPRPPAKRIDGTADMKEMRFFWSEFLEAESRIQQLEPMLSNTGLSSDLKVEKGMLVRLNAPLFQGTREISYSYLTQENVVRVNKQEIVLPERPIPAMGMIDKMSSGGTNQHNTVRYHLQGRQCEVQWAFETNQMESVLLPKQIEVHVIPPVKTLTLKPNARTQLAFDAKSNLVAERKIEGNLIYGEYSDLGKAPIRSAQIIKWDTINPALADFLTTTNALYCRPGPARRQWSKEIEVKYWHGGMEESDPNRALLTHLIEEMKQEAGRSSDPAEKLRFNYTQIISDLVLNDEKAFADHVADYISLLKDAQAQEVAAACLASLSRLCSLWNRDVFVSIVEAKIASLSPSEK